MNPSQRIIIRALKGMKKPMLGTALFAKASKAREKIKNKGPMPKGTYGVNLGQMIKSGYISEARHPTEGKNKLYKLTETGVMVADALNRT